jgi:hypothetical protein
MLAKTPSARRRQRLLSGSTADFVLPDLLRRMPDDILVVEIQRDASAFPTTFSPPQADVLASGRSICVSPVMTAFDPWRTV